MHTKIGQSMLGRRGPSLDLKGAILDRIRPDKSILVWTPNDFLDLGTHPPSIRHSNASHLRVI
jgi:hypothetical protein